MKRNTILVLITVIVISLGLFLVPTVFSQPENVEILSYSWYMHPSGGEALVVVGEVRNTGQNVIDHIYVEGTFHTPDGEPYIASVGTWQLTRNTLPQQKRPFYIVFTPRDIIGSDEWTTADATNFTAAVSFANITNLSQYDGLQVISHTASEDVDGFYKVTGNVQNTGNEATNRTWVVATFYNSTGSVVAIGFSSYLTPTSIAPGNTATFEIYPYDYSSAIVSQIESYSLIIQTELTTPDATPTPTPSPTASPSPTPPSSPTPTPTGSGNGIAINDLYVYATVAVIIIVVVVAALVLRKRSSKNAALQGKQNNKQVFPLRTSIQQLLRRELHFQWSVGGYSTYIAG